MIRLRHFGRNVTAVRLDPVEVTALNQCPGVNTALLQRLTRRGRQVNVFEQRTLFTQLIQPVLTNPIARHILRTNPLI